MRRVRMLAPFEAIQGNLSGRQDLRYAENDNKAYESPAGKKNYARNYTPRYVGSYITKSGKSIFRVKTKTAVHMTAKATKAMALLGGAGAVYGALIKVKTTATYLAVLAQYNALVALGEKRSFQQYCMANIRQAILANAENVTFAGPATLAQFKNPWYDGSMSADVTISTAVLVKFWPELTEDGFNFEVDSQKGIAMSDNAFNDIIGTGRNVLNLSTVQVSDTTYVKQGASWLKDSEGAYVVDSDDIIPNGKYTLTATAPTA